MKKIKFIDLFAGLGGTRIGFQQACDELGIESKCVFTSEIKPYAVEIYRHNFGSDEIHGDITQIDAKEIPNFDFLLGGFPCQAFSVAGNRKGFEDTRGTLFFDVARVIKEKKPKGFLLENVEGLVTHDKGRTLETIINVLDGLGYNVDWKVLDSSDFGVAQRRKRIYIIGRYKKKISLDGFNKKTSVLADILEKGLPPLETKFTKKLLELYRPSDLEGKSIKDKRGGSTNIHSWDLELKGKISKDQKELLNCLLLQRRKKVWAEIKGIKWMDGMPLTLSEIHSFYAFLPKKSLKVMLDDLVEKKYLSFEHPKDLIENGTREYSTGIEKGYNIVTGKLSFELNKILDRCHIAPTIVATEADRYGVIDGGKIRRLSEKECLRLFGYPDWYSSNIKHSHLYDLVGNTVVVPVIKEVALKLI
jgi:DNA (cytosine-5)-methyltransferase 1